MQVAPTFMYMTFQDETFQTTTDAAQFRHATSQKTEHQTRNVECHLTYEKDEFFLEQEFLHHVSQGCAKQFSLPKELKDIKGYSLAYTHQDKKIYISGGKCGDRWNSYLYFFDLQNLKWNHFIIPLLPLWYHGSLVFKNNIVFFGGKNNEEISWVDLKTMKQTLLTKFKAKYCISNNDSCWMFNEHEILLVQKEMSLKTFLHEIPLDFDHIDRMTQWIQQIEKKINIIHDILDQELNTLFAKPTQETLDKLPMLNHFQGLVHQFPLLLKVKEKNTLLKLIPILRDVEKSFKIRLTYYFKYMIASIYASVIQIKNQSVPIYENSTLSILYELGDAYTVLDTLKKVADYKSLPHKYKEANHLILKNLMILPIPDSLQLSKLKWYNRVISILKPLTSIISPQQLVSKFIEILFSTIGKHGTMLILEVAKTEQQLKDVKKGLYTDVTEITEKIYRYPCEQDMTILHEEIRTFKEQNGLDDHQEGLFEEFVQISIRYKEKMMFVKSLEDPSTYSLMKQFLEMFTPLFQLMTPMAVQILLGSASRTITRMIQFGEKHQRAPNIQSLWENEVNDIILRLERDLHELVHELVIHDPKNGKIFEQTIGWITCLGMMWRDASIEEISTQSILECIKGLKI